MEIKAKLSLAVDGFKSGLSTAKKELDTFGASGSKFNSKFAQDIRSSFDNIGPGIKRVNREVSRDFDKLTKEIASNNKAALGNIWNPLSQGFNKATAKIAVNSAVIGGFFKNMTKSASTHAKDVDALIERNTRNRIIGAQRAADFEARVAQSNRRIDKASMREQYGARPAGSATGRGAVAAPDTRIKLASFTAPAQDKGSLKSRVDLYKQDAIRLASEIKTSAQILAVRRGLVKDASAAEKILVNSRKDSLKRQADEDKKYAKQMTANRKAEEQRYTAWLKQNTEYQLKLRAQKKVDFFNSTDFEKNMASTRYALYDIGQRFLAFGVGVTAALAQTVVASAKFESAFTSVERTTGLTGAPLEKLRQSLVDLSTTMPVSFEQITQIATLGAQMGIAGDQVDQFAQTVARFANITGIGVEEVAQSFGRLGVMMDVPTSKFENLASAIAFSGVSAVATDKEILAMSESIATTATQAGFSADEVIGLSTALASLKVRPEEARGVLTRLFRTIDLGVSQSGTQLDDFAKVVGKSSVDTAALWKQDPSAFFNSFLAGAAAAGTLNETISALGITNTRELNVIQRLAGNIDLLKEAQKDANEEFLLGSYATEAYGKVADDLQSKFIMLQSTFTEFQASVGDTMAPAVGAIIDGLSGLLKMLADAPVALKFIGSAIGLLVAGFAIFFSTIAMGIAGLLAMKLALKNLAGEGIKASISVGTLIALLKSMRIEAGATSGVLGLLTGATAKTSAGFRIAGMSAKAFQASLGIIGLVLTAVAVGIEIFSNSAAKSEQTTLDLGRAAIDASGGLELLNKALAADAKAYAIAKAAGEDVSKGYSVLKTASTELSSAKEIERQSVLDAARAHQESVANVGKETGSTDELTGALDLAAEAKKGLNDETQRAIDLAPENEVIVGTETKRLLMESVRSYATEDGQTADLVVQAGMSPVQKAAAEAFGYDYGAMVQAGIDKAGGSEAYTKKIDEQFQDFSKGLRAALGSAELKGKGPTEVAKTIQQIGAVMGLTQEKINGLKSAYAGLGVSQAAAADTTLPGFYVSAAKSIDGQNAVIVAGKAANEEWANSLDQSGVAAMSADDAGKLLSEQLTTLNDDLTKLPLANAKAAKGFASFSKSVEKTNGDIGQMTSESTAALEAWASFTSDALSAANLDGSGAVGYLTRVSAGIIVLEQAGKNTDVQMANLKTTLSTAFPEATGDVLKLIAALQLQPNMAGMKAAAQAAIDLAVAAGKPVAEIAKLQAVLAAIGGGNFVADYKSMVAEIDNLADSAGKAKTALEKFIEAFDKLLSKTTTKLGLESALDTLGTSMAKNKKVFSVYSEAGRSNMSSLEAAIKAVATNTKGAPQATANSLEALRQAMMKAGVTAGPAMAMITAAIKATGKKGKAAAGELKMILGSITGSLTEAAKAEARTISDYISDISGILNDALRNRYGKQEAKDSLAGAWRSIGQAAKDAAKAIAEANKEIKTTVADQAVLTYQLGIAVKYGDTKRAAVIQAKLDDATASLAENNVKLAEAQANSNKSLTDATEAGANNRKQIRDIVASMNDYLMTMARAGKSNADLKTEAKTLSDDFMKQGKALGFAEKELQAYADAFTGDFTKAVTAVPSDITLKVNTDPALAAIEEFVAKAKDSLGTIGIIAPAASTTAPAVVKPTVTAAQKETIASLASQVSTTTAQIVALQKSPVKNAAAILVLEAKRDRLRQRAAAVTAPITKANGGYISGPGTSTSDSIPAMLSNGEYVIKANAVSKYGVDFMNSINQMKAARPMPSGIGGGAVGGSSVVYLSPEDRQLLRAAMDRPIALYTENSKIAQSANAGNVVLAQRGTN